MSEITINLPENFTLAQAKQLQADIQKLISEVIDNKNTALKTEGEVSCHAGYDRGGFSGGCSVGFKF